MFIFALIFFRQGACSGDDSASNGFDFTDLTTTTFVLPEEPLTPLGDATGTSVVIGGTASTTSEAAVDPVPVQNLGAPVENGPETVSIDGATYLPPDETDNRVIALATVCNNGLTQGYEAADFALVAPDGQRSAFRGISESSLIPDTAFRDVTVASGECFSGTMEAQISLATGRPLQVVYRRNGRDIAAWPVQ